MVVLFQLVANRRDEYVRRTGDLEKRHVTRAPEWNDQFAQEGALPGFAASEGGSFEGGEARSNGVQSLFGQREISNSSTDFALDHEVKQALKIRLGLTGEAYPEAHRRCAGLRVRAASSLCWSVRKTSSATT